MTNDVLPQICEMFTSPVWQVCVMICSDNQD